MNRTLLKNVLMILALIVAISCTNQRDISVAQLQRHYAQSQKMLDTYGSQTRIENPAGALTFIEDTLTQHMDLEGYFVLNGQQFPDSLCSDWHKNRGSFLGSNPLEFLEEGDSKITAFYRNYVTVCCLMETIAGSFVCYVSEAGGEIDAQKSFATFTTSDKPFRVFWADSVVIIDQKVQMWTRLLPESENVYFELDIVGQESTKEDFLTSLADYRLLLRP